MSSPERNAEVAPVKEIGVAVEVVASLYSHFDRRIPLIVDPYAAYSGKHILIPIRQKLDSTAQQRSVWRKYNFRQSDPNTGLTGFLPRDQVYPFSRRLGSDMTLNRLVHEIVQDRFLPILKPFDSKLSQNDFFPPMGRLLSSIAIHNGPTGLKFMEVFDLLPSDDAIKAIELAQEMGSGLLLVHPEDILEGQTTRIRYKEKIVDASFHPDCKVLCDTQFSYAAMAHLDLAASAVNPKLRDNLTHILNSSVPNSGNRLKLPDKVEWGPVVEFEIPEEFLEIIPFYHFIREFLFNMDQGGSLDTHHLTEDILRKMREVGNGILVSDLEKSLFVSRIMSKILTRTLYFLGEGLMVNDSLGPIPGLEFIQDKVNGIFFILGAKGLTYLTGRFSRELIEEVLEEVLLDIADNHSVEQKFLNVDLRTFAGQASKILAEAETYPAPLQELSATMAALPAAYTAHQQYDKALLSPVIIYSLAWLANKFFLEPEYSDANDTTAKSKRIGIKKNLVRTIVRSWPLIVGSLITNRLISGDTIGFGIVLGHLLESIVPMEDIKRAKKVKRTLSRILDQLSVTINTPKELIGHNLRILQDEKLDFYYAEGKRRFRKLDEISALFPEPPESFMVFDNYTIGRNDKKFVTNGRMALAGGKVNVLQINNDSQLSYCLATFGEKFDHLEGDAFYRDQYGNDRSIHELPLSWLVHYFNCEPKETVVSQDIFSEFYTSTIAARLKENLGPNYHVVFAREIDQARREELLYRYLKSTGMFDDKELKSWNPHGRVSEFMAMRMKVAAAFLPEGLIILDDIYDSRFYEREKWNMESVSGFIAREVKKRKDLIVLLGINDYRELPREIFTQEKVLGEKYTVRNQKIVRIPTRKN